MTILAFWTVDNDSVDCNTLNGVSDVDAFDILWHKRDELETRFYNMERSSCGDPFGPRGILDASDFEDDYNDGELDDAGLWTKVLVLDEDYVKQIINE